MAVNFNRTDKYKMIIYPAANRVRLYDMQKDSMEMNDLAENKEQYGELLNSLFTRLVKLQKELNDPIDIKKAFDNFMNNVPPPPLPPLVEVKKKTKGKQGSPKKESKGKKRNP